MAADKYDNMHGSEISGEVYCRCISPSYNGRIQECVCQIILNNECINMDTGIHVADVFDIKWLDHFSELHEAIYDVLYDSDAIWMTAIQKAMGDMVTDTQCGGGMIELKSGKA